MQVAAAAWVAAWVMVGRAVAHEAGVWAVESMEVGWMVVG